jgi:5-methylcytosine-specific restriction endonuclease McrA
MDTLVLSQSYQPVGRIPWQRAMTLFFLGKVEVIEEYENREVRSVTISLQMPSIVRFLHKVRRKKKAVKFSRENVYTRDKGRCQYCGCKTPRVESTYDHVIPRSQGGKTTWTNIVIACRTCNQKKGGRTPEQARMRLRTRPVRPKTLPNTWKITFTWQEGMPTSWKDFLATVAYWNSEIE